MSNNTKTSLDAPKNRLTAFSPAIVLALLASISGAITYFTAGRPVSYYSIRVCEITIYSMVIYLLGLLSHQVWKR